MRQFLSIVGVALACFPATPVAAAAQLDFEKDPINYSKTPATDPVAGLIRDLSAGRTRLTRDEQHGYLRSVLEQLRIPVSSQTLVFSKTSFQRHRISPRTPRALYFNDDVYVGWVPHGDLIEISAADPVLGAVFYTLDQQQTTSQPVIQRQTDHCLICHASTHTRRVPGHIMRSVYADRGGLPVLASGTYRTDQASPLSERWGGWYVTGSHGQQRHMGNQVVASRRKPEELDREAGANITDISDKARVAEYLSPHSDIVALLVLGHQVTVHNAITEANFAARRTAFDTEVMNKTLGRPAGFESPAATQRYLHAAQRLVRVLLMADEASLTDQIAGSSSFTEEFQQPGPADSAGRSLRQLDLKTRLFRHPCSYLIYSPAFTSLPPRLLRDVYSELTRVLTAEMPDPEFDHLSAADRLAILEILRETVPGMAAARTPAQTDTQNSKSNSTQPPAASHPEDK